MQIKIFVLIITVCMEIYSMFGAQRTPLWSWFSPFTFVLVLEIKASFSDLHSKHLYSLSHLSCPIVFFLKTVSCCVTDLKVHIFL